MLPNAVPWTDVRERNETHKLLRALLDSTKNDRKTKEALKLFVKDEVSSIEFLKNACAELNAPAQAGTMQAKRPDDGIAG